MKKGKFDLRERFIDFSVQVISISEELPKTFVGQHLANQIVRSGSSPAFQYAEACDAESRKDFIHKLKIGVKELRETLVCLEIIRRKSFINEENLKSTCDECNELISIMVSSIKTAKRNDLRRKS